MSPQKKLLLRRNALFRQQLRTPQCEEAIADCQQIDLSVNEQPKLTAERNTQQEGIPLIPFQS